MIIYRKTECIQSYLRIWGRYDPIESGPSDTKKWGLYRRSIEKNRFLAKNGPRRPLRDPSCNGVNTKLLSFWCPVITDDIEEHQPSFENITNIDVDLIRQPEGPNWPTVGGGIFLPPKILDPLWPCLGPLGVVWDLFGTLLDPFGIRLRPY